MNLSDRDTPYYDQLNLGTNIRQRIAMVLAKRDIGISETPENTVRAAEALVMLNKRARYDNGGQWRHDIYAMKSKFLQAMNAYGYLKSVKLCQQILKCYSCTNGIWNRGAYNEDICWNCGGTGIYKRIVLITFEVVIGDRTFTWHQPADRAGWAIPLLGRELPTEELEIGGLPRFKEESIPYAQLTDWQIQKAMLYLAVWLSRFMMFESIELCDWKHALLNDVNTIANRVGRWFYFHLPQRHEELPF